MKIQVRRGTTAQWASADAAGRFLAQGEFGRNTTTGDIKMGDGVSAWAALTAIGSGSGVFAGVITVNGAGTSNFVGPIRFVTAGVGIQMQTGANAAIGTATLVAGTVTVATTAVTGASLIFVTCQTPAGTPGFLRVANKVNGVGFDIVSSNAADTSTVAWIIVSAL